jgi:hypothetical protein
MSNAVRAVKAFFEAVEPREAQQVDLVALFNEQLKPSPGTFTKIWNDYVKEHKPEEPREMRMVLLTALCRTNTLTPAWQEILADKLADARDSAREVTAMYARDAEQKAEPVEAQNPPQRSAKVFTDKDVVKIGQTDKFVEFLPIFILQMGDHGIPESEFLRYLTKALEGHKLQKQLTFARVGNASYREVIRQLALTEGPNPALKAKREFKRMRQNVNESATEFLNRYRLSQAVCAALGVKLDEPIEDFIDRLRDRDAVLLHARSKVPSNLLDVCELAELFAASSQDRKKVNLVRDEADEDYDHPMVNTVSRKYPLPSKHERLPCWLCDSPDHNARNCQWWGHCEVCGEKGHAGAKCKACFWRKPAAETKAPVAPAKIPAASAKSFHIVPSVHATIDDVKLEAWVDTGAEVSLLRKDIAEFLLDSWPTHSVQLSGIATRTTGAGPVTLDMNFDGVEGPFTREIEFYIVDDPSGPEVLLGMAAGIQSINLRTNVLSFGRDRVHLVGTVASDSAVNAVRISEFTTGGGVKGG